MNGNVSGYATMFSPPAWGWSEGRCGSEGGGDVLPTSVGMVRNHAMASAIDIGSPHPRGDGPLAGVYRNDPR